MRHLQRLRCPASSFPTCTVAASRTASTASLLSASSLSGRTQLSPRQTEQPQSPSQRRDLSTTPVQLKNRLVIPPPKKTALRAGEITDPSYTPAESAVGLEEVGGLEGWWDRPGHYDASIRYVGFGPLEKVTDRAVLEVLTRQALIEALVLAQKEKAFDVTLPGSKWRREVLTSEITAGPGGEAMLSETMSQRVLSLAPQDGKRQKEHVLEPSAAQELIKTWDSSWRTLQLRDLVVKFWLGRRIQQLTGHMIPDFKMLGLATPSAVVAHLAQPPKPRKVVEEIENKGLLSDLPNVQVFARRVTPVDKEKMVGRWKIIEKELQKRSLPVLGTGGLRKTIDKSWIEGSV